MRSVMSPLLMLALLIGCSTAPISINKKAVSELAPDVMTMPLNEQQQAAKEMQGRQCPALNTVANLCLVTLDEARAEK